MVIAIDAANCIIKVETTAVLGVSKNYKLCNKKIKLPVPSVTDNGIRRMNELIFNSFFSMQ